MRLSETSGLHPNAAYFLALPPDVYLDGPALDADGAAAPAASALSGVSITFALAGAPTDASGARAAVDVVHVPPLEFEPAWREATVSAFEGFEGQLGIIVFDHEAGVGKRLLAGLAARGRAYILRVAGPRAAAVPGDAHDLGAVDRWHEALTDPVPPAVRDPESLLARAYRSVAEYVLAEARFDGTKTEDSSDRPPAGAYRRAARRGASAAFTRPR